MADYTPLFEKAIAFTLAHEGGFVDDPVDPGGATNWGISLRFARAQGELDADGDGWPDLDVDHDGDIDADDIRKLTRVDAIGVYHARFWQPGQFEDYPGHSGIKAFDYAVNMGPRQAAKLTQRALRACGEAVADDGRIGPKSREALGNVPPDLFVIGLRSEAAGFYRALIAARPQLAKYRRGWLNRAYA